MTWTTVVLLLHHSGKSHSGRETFSNSCISSLRLCVFGSFTSSLIRREVHRCTGYQAQMPNDGGSAIKGCRQARLASCSVRGSYTAGRWMSRRRRRGAGMDGSVPTMSPEIPTTTIAALLVYGCIPATEDALRTGAQFRLFEAHQLGYEADIGRNAFPPF